MTSTQSHSLWAASTRAVVVEVSGVTTGTLSTGVITCATVRCAQSQASPAISLIIASVSTPWTLPRSSITT
ncbi:hypothetical protein [Candidatus Amarobacter glycogenicus]|uniref:hypothetical protein n=1 Tax=Candidatus Amarobacter glycogenicus TaxID=3140699 RepID=UPI003135E685|nr:hypothetical protein [Dehalococcoidia bacterium]